MARKEIILEGSRWRTQDDFYDAFFLAVGSPKSHARHLDALADSICGGQINDVDIPYTLVIRGYDRMEESARRFADRVCRILLELKAEGCDIDIRCE
ncbi:MAG TPA: barstar family protein [Methylomirabilota bacterium]